MPKSRHRKNQKQRSITRTNKLKAEIRKYQEKQKEEYMKLLKDAQAQQVANEAGYSIVPDSHWVSDEEGSLTKWNSSVICAEYDVFIKVERPKRGRDRVESDAAIIKRVSKLAENYIFTAFKQEGNDEEE